MNWTELETLCRLNGTSGREMAVREWILSVCKTLSLPEGSVTVDQLGNVMVHRQGRARAKRRLMLAAHMDEVAMMVTGIVADGSLQFGCVGGIDAAALLGRPVTVGSCAIPGVIGAKPVHRLRAEEKNTPVEKSTLFVDIGAKDRADAETVVALGDSIYFPTLFRRFGDGAIAAKALDDRVGCAVLLQLLRMDLPYDTWFAFTVQEEVGLRGAGVVAQAIAPDVAVVMEATTAADLAGETGAEAVCRLRGGAVISYMDGRTVYDAELYRLATQTATDNGIPWQTKTKIAGGNDAGAIQHSGARVLAISVPCRYLHSPVCVVAEQDVCACERLAAALIPAIIEAKED